MKYFPVLLLLMYARLCFAQSETPSFVSMLGQTRPYIIKNIVRDRYIMETNDTLVDFKMDDDMAIAVTFDKDGISDRLMVRTLGDYTHQSFIRYLDKNCDKTVKDGRTLWDCDKIRVVYYYSLQDKDETVLIIFPL